MKGIKKYLKLKYFTSSIKMTFYKIFYKNIKFKGYRYCIESKVQFESVNEGLIILSDKIYFSRYCMLKCISGSINIGYNTFFNVSCKIISMERIDIGSNCLFGPNVSIYDHDHKYEKSEKLICKQGFTKDKVKIGSDVWIGANVVITKGVYIEDRVIVGANSVVTKNLKSNGLYAGNPARLIKKLNE